MLYHSHSPTKPALAEQLIRIIRLLISGYWTLKNTAAFTQDLDKFMLIYNQCLRRSFSNSSPLEVHHSNNALHIFLKQYCSETVVKQKLILLKQFESIEQVKFFKRGITCGFLNFLKYPKS